MRDWVDRAQAHGKCPILPRNGNAELLALLLRLRLFFSASISELICVNSPGAEPFP
jgi:hypothetical protein